jgi:hypothetical protein
VTAICAACSWPARLLSSVTKIHGTKHRPWLTALLVRRPTKVTWPGVSDIRNPSRLHDKRGRAGQPA